MQGHINCSARRPHCPRRGHTESPTAELPELGAGGKTEQCHSGCGDAERRDLARAQLAVEAVAGQVDTMVPTEMIMDTPPAQDTPAPSCGYMLGHAAAQQRVRRGLG